MVMRSAPAVSTPRAAAASAPPPPRPFLSSLSAPKESLPKITIVLKQVN